MICQVCQYDILTVADKVQRFNDCDTRLLRCPQCRTEYICESRIKFVLVKHPEKRGHYELAIAKLSAEMREFILGRRLHPDIKAIDAA